LYPQPLQHRLGFDRRRDCQPIRERFSTLLVGVFDVAATPEPMAGGHQSPAHVFVTWVKVRTALVPFGGLLPLSDLLTAHTQPERPFEQPSPELLIDGPGYRRFRFGREKRTLIEA